MKFDQYQIAASIKTSISKLGYKRPTDIQFKSIPAILKGEDVLAIAQTGTGKTAAFAIPLIHLIHTKKLKFSSPGVKCLVMAPTHELALQLESVFVSLSKQTKVTTVCIHGGVDQDPQKERLENGVDIVIATPGRLFDLVSQRSLNLKKIEYLVLDEADHMLDLGFIKDIKDLMRHIPRYRQTLFFSATISEKIKKLAYSLVTNPIRIQISPKDPVAKNIEHSVAFIAMDDKRFFLSELINQNPDSKILVFVRTKVRAERVKNAMANLNITADSIHSDKTANQREETMHQFRYGKLKTLIATDVSARGIDIPNVEFVVNYDLPESPEHYVHRVGRTGRGDQKGQAYSFCADQEKELLQSIESSLGKPIQRLSISKKNYEYTVDTNNIKPKHNYQDILQEIEQLESSRKKKKKK